MRKYLLTFVLAAIISVATVSLVSAAPGLQGGGTVHYVTFGETLYSIATRYGVTADMILRHNGLFNPDLIYVGQPLIIPGPYGNVPGNVPGRQPSAGSYGCGNVHIVSAGETLSDIAYSYGVSLQELLGHNDIYNSHVVYVGQKVCLPNRARSGYAPQPANYQQVSMPPRAHYHTVATGETLHYIGNQYNVAYMDIARANNLSSAGYIWAGQRLYIPGYQPAPPPVRPAPDHRPVAQPDYSPPPDHRPVAQPDYSPPPDHRPVAQPDYGPPPAVPLRAPKYDEPYDEAVVLPESLPEAPDYQPSPVLPLLPEADHPIEVVVNGGITWVGETITPFDDPNNITTLIVSTAEKDEQREVRLRSGDYEVHGELGLVPEFGIDKFRFAFKYIPPGDYDVWIDDPDIPSERVQVKVEAGKRVEIMFRKGVAFSGPTFASPDGWILASWDNPSEPGKNIGGWSNILVQTPASGLWVNIESEGGGYQAMCFTGTKGPGACDFAGLNAGLYRVWIDGTDLTLLTYMDGNAYATFAFARQPGRDDKDFIGPVDYD